MTRSRTYIATPPGATIKEQLDNRGMNQKEFASRMDMSQKHISRLINGEVQLTPDVANRLEMVLGLPARFWNKLEATYREKIAKAEAENAMDEDCEIVKKFPYKQMAEYNWVPETKNAKEKVVSLRQFFEVAELSLIQSKDTLIPRIACRRQSITEKADYALVAWAQKAKLEARNYTVSKINVKHLEQSLMEIREMTTMSPNEFCPRLRSLLAGCGIVIIYLPHIGGSFLHGATFYDRNKIVIGLTVRGRDADKFWFSLFHEIGHVILGHINQEEGTTSEDESAADDFAREHLISRELFDPFARTGDFRKEAIIAFAKKIGVDPGIVVGRLQKEGLIEFSWHNDLKRKYKISA